MRSPTRQGGVLVARVRGTVLQDERFQVPVDLFPGCLCPRLQGRWEPLGSQHMHAFFTDSAIEQTEPPMHKYSYLFAAVIALGCLTVEASAQSMRYSFSESRETPEANVRKSQWYDYLLSINARFRTYRIHKECSPINYSGALHQDCVVSFDTYEPIRPGYH